jgi:hypothetical protein
MAMFGISHTVNTRVGDDFVRGVSVSYYLARSRTTRIANWLRAENENV